MTFVATIKLATPTCGASELLHDGQRLRCLGLGGLFGAYGLLEGPASTETNSLEGDPTGLAQVPRADCQACPLQALPAGVRPVSAEVRSDSLQLQILVQDDDQVTHALHSLRDAGQGPRRVQTLRGPAGISGFTVLWQTLTARQRETLETAQRMGYYEPGGADVGQLAQELGVSRSTAHEHLQKALGRLLDTMFDAA